MSYKDGIKLYFSNGDWVLIRSSGTEPLLRVSMETQSPNCHLPLAAALKQLIRRW